AIELHFLKECRLKISKHWDNAAIEIGAQRLCFDRRVKVDQFAILAAFLLELSHKYHERKKEPDPGKQGLFTLARLLDSSPSSSRPSRLEKRSSLPAPASPWRS